MFIHASLRDVVHKLDDSNNEETLACQACLLVMRCVWTSDHTTYISEVLVGMCSEASRLKMKL